MNHKEKILLIDDELSLLQSLKRSLRKDYEVHPLQNPLEVENTLEEHGPFKVVISDMSMPEMTGDQVLAQVKESSPLSMRILLTGNSDVESSVRAVNYGHIFKYLQKPCSTEDLKAVINEALEYYELLSSQYQQAIARQKELNIAARIQQKLLHSPAPHSSLLSFDTFFHAAKEVGGDFYEFIEQSPYCIDILIGDVMGKGVPAALMGASLKSQIPKSVLACSIKEGGIASIANIMTHLNTKICPQLIQFESFVTLLYLRVDLLKQEVEFIDCGHTEFLIKHSDNTVDEIKGSNMPLGFLEDEAYVSRSVPFVKGDILLSYTDGITEIPVGTELFGVKRLKNLMASNQNAETLISEITNHCAKYQDFKEANDDLTMISVHYPRQPQIFLNGEVQSMKKLHAFLEKELDTELPRYGQIATVASELYTNFCRYGFTETQNRKVITTLYIDKHEIGLHFCHNGLFFKPESITEPDITEMNESGYGLFIVQEYCDEITYSQEENNWSTIKTTFRLSED